ncbi:MAG: HD domain-containing protein [Candidatus Margulisbacteria bacterium]|nr:HD domain-containing protein [Candidatus Margulisiibacteriota bacterium]
MNYKIIAWLNPLNLNDLPFILISQPVSLLEKQLFSIIESNFSPADINELKNAYTNAKLAHARTGAVREGSGVPYIHHPLSVAIFVWYLATMVNFQNVDKKLLLLGAIYHDTIEDTEIFDTKDSGVQFSGFCRLHGEDLGKILLYVTKIPLAIDKKYVKLRNHFKRLHLHQFMFDFIPMESRYIKIADRILNMADLSLTTDEFAKKTIALTEKHFYNVLLYLPEEIKTIFDLHFSRVKAFLK